MQEEELRQHRDEMADALRKLRPARPDTAAAREAWFEAGYRSGRKSLNMWRAAAAVLMGGTVAVTALERGGQGRAAPQMPVAVERPSDQKLATGDPSYARLRDALVRDGLRGLGGPELPSGNPNSPQDERSADDASFQGVYPVKARGRS